MVFAFEAVLGLLAGLATSVLPSAAIGALMLPARWGCRWVLDVARLATAWSPHGGMAWVAWSIQGLLLALLMRVRRATLRRAILST